MLAPHNCSADRPLSDSDTVSTCRLLKSWGCDDGFGMARIFPEFAPAGPRGRIPLDLVIRVLPADRLHMASAVSRTLALASVGVEPAECGPPCIGYRDALATRRVPALLWYWRTKIVRPGDSAVRPDCATMLAVAEPFAAHCLGMGCLERPP